MSEVEVGHPTSGVIPIYSPIMNFSQKEDGRGQEEVGYWTINQQQATIPGTTNHPTVCPSHQCTTA